MRTAGVDRLVVVLAVPVADPSPVPGVARDRLQAALLGDAVDNAELLAAAEIAVLGVPTQVVAVADAVAVDTVVWRSETPTVAEAATMAAARGAGQVVVVASDAPHLPGLLVGKLFRPLGRAEVTISPDPRGYAVAVGLRLPMPDWTGEIDLDDPEIVETLNARAPRRALVRTTPGWRRLREPSDFAELDATPDGADLTRALLT
jgi:glycosyltransferase A (GT-A) superfamily protein (DUF2064 family)